MCSVHWMIKYIGGVSTLGGYHEYIRGISWVHQGDILSTSGDIQYIGGLSWFMWGGGGGGYHEYIRNVQCIQVFDINRSLLSISILMIYLWCTEHCLQWYPSNVLSISWCTEDIPPMYWTPSWCTEHLQMYWTPLDVLSIPRCTELTQYTGCKCYTSRSKF